jgi:pyridoxal phosphate enzyme (YggS family)
VSNIQVYRQNLLEVKQKITEACQNVNRNANEVRIIGVTKTVSATEIVPLLQAGLREFGENRWQQAKPKLEVPESREAVWHFIGRLQQNKVKYVVPNFDWIHSVDSVELGQAIHEMAVKCNKTINCLVQVNVSGEATKAGVHPEQVESVVESLMAFRGLSIRGLMTMAPIVSDMEETRPVFRRLREILYQLQERFPDSALTELSMGMSEDFPIAVEEGATMVRIGRRIMDTAR